jgi:hypothetical protein
MTMVVILSAAKNLSKGGSPALKVGYVSEHARKKRLKYFHSMIEYE